MTEEHLNLDELESASLGETLDENLQEHLSVCKLCQGESQCLTALSLTKEVPSISLVGEQILNVRRVRRRVKFQRMSSVASIVLVAVLVSLGNPFGSDASSRARSLSVAWLEGQQASDGAWKVENWGGKARFRVGISSMALLAILKEPGHNREVVSRGLSFLLGEQKESGVIGEPFLGDLYNHSLATLVLREAGERGYQIPTKTLRLATAFLENQRQEGGLWGYRLRLAPERNLSAWAARAMAKALEAPTKDFGKELVSESETFDEVRKVSWQKRLDPMSAYLEGLNLSKSKRKDWELSLVSRQEREGVLAGSWPADDRWGKVGGRVFCTGMAALALD